MATIIKGVGVSSGVASGPAFVLVYAHRVAVPRRTILPTAVEGELKRLEAALATAEQELRALEKSLSDAVGPRTADIFGAHALLVRSLIQPVTRSVRDQLVNVEAALLEVVDGLVHSFERVKDPYLRERASDIRDVGRRVLRTLAKDQASDIPEGAIIVTDELLPSLTACLELNSVRALVSERGGKSSHGAILARAHGTPAVSAIANATTRITTGDHLIVDGVSGVVFVNPEKSIELEYQSVEADIRSHRQQLAHLVDLPSVTLDGTPIPLLANINKFADTEAAFLFKADGIGLYRTEFGYSIRDAFPTEEEQYEFFKRAAERFHPRKVVFRLLDIGGDKELPYFPLPPAHNPSLAERGIRLLLRHPEILKHQLRAFLRVSAEHPVAILVPVVAGSEELSRTRAAMRHAQRELLAEGKEFNAKIEVGAMIEVPAAAVLVHALAKEADFFSLGTNDLVQYTLAADRDDETTASYYQPLHPAVLHLIHGLSEAATLANREVTICGEMAGNSSYTALLLGLGLRSFSVAPGQLLEVKNAIRATRLDEAKGLARQALELNTVNDIEKLIAAKANPSRPFAIPPHRVRTSR